MYSVGKTSDNSTLYIPAYVYVGTLECMTLLVRLAVAGWLLAIL